MQTCKYFRLVLMNVNINDPVVCRKQQKSTVQYRVRACLKSECVWESKFASRNRRKKSRWTTIGHHPNSKHIFEENNIAEWTHHNITGVILVSHHGVGLSKLMISCHSEQNSASCPTNWRRSLWLPSTLTVWTHDENESECIRTNVENLLKINLEF